MTERWRSSLVDVLLAASAFVIDGLGSTGRVTTWGSVLPGWVVPALVAVAALTLLVRRTRPLLTFTVWWVVGLLPLVVVGREQFVGLMIALATIAASRPLRTAVATAVVCVVPMQLDAWDVRRRQSGFGVADDVLLVVVWLLPPLVACGLGRIIYLLRERLELQQKVHAAELSSVIRDERLHLARDLHDIVAHSVSAMILQAAGARSLSTDTDVRVKTALRSIELTGAEAMKELHRLLGLLRETASDDTPRLSAQPGLENIDQILTTTRACGVEVELRESGTRRRLDPAVSYTAFRMVQECMANVIKHGGAGARSTIEIVWRDEGLDVTIRNDEHDAVSASMLSGGYGLRGLTERVQEVGGRFAAGPAEESIFVASMSLPLRLAAGTVGGG